MHALYVISISTDTTFDNGPAAYWSAIEANVGIICASLPTLKAFISRCSPRLFSTSAGTRTWYGTGITAVSVPRSRKASRWEEDDSFIRVQGVSSVEMKSVRGDSVEKVQDMDIHVTTIVSRTEEGNAV